MPPFAISSGRWKTTSGCPYFEGFGRPPEAAGHPVCGLIPETVPLLFGEPCHQLTLFGLAFDRSIQPGIEQTLENLLELRSRL